eukprot:scaffold19863_cov52-Attheya_sp.AAC.5
MSDEKPTVDDDDVPMQDEEAGEATGPIIRKTVKPYGASLISVMFAASAFICSTASSYTCSFVRLSVLVGESGSTLGFMTRGIWGGQVTPLRTCSKYSGDVIDALTRTSRAFSVLVTIFGAMCMLMVFMLYAAPPRLIRASMISMGNACMFCCLFQGLTLCLIPSDLCKGASIVTGTTASCELDIGAKLSISAVVFWFFAGSSMAPTPGEMEMVREEQEKLIAEVDAAKTEVKAHG